jgi:hypothetical protein
LIFGAELNRDLDERQDVEEEQGQHFLLSGEEEEAGEGGQRPQVQFNRLKYIIRLIDLPTLCAIPIKIPHDFGANTYKLKR